MIFPPPTNKLPFIKICGLTRLEDARLALELGATFLGFILTRKSPRYIPAASAAVLIQALRQDFPGFLPIGVYVDEPAPEQQAALRDLSLAAVQIHGRVDDAVPILGAERVIPAVAIRDAESATQLAALPGGHPAVLADAFSESAHGGTGKVFNHSLVQPLFPSRRVFVAGGIAPSNIASVVASLAPGALPYAFDLSSGVESAPGIKSPDKLREFFGAYRRALSEKYSTERENG